MYYFCYCNCNVNSSNYIKKVVLTMGSKKRCRGCSTLRRDLCAHNRRQDSSPCEYNDHFLQRRY